MNNTPECTLGLVKPRYTPSKKHSEYSVSIQNPSDKLLNLGPESPPVLTNRVENFINP